MLKKIKHHWTPGSPIDRQNSPHPAASLVGAPDDRGVLNVGGRLGAGLGPKALRRMFSEFMLGMNGEIAGIELFEGRDIALEPTIELTHDAVRDEVFHLLRSKVTPIVIGGGHDYGFPHIAAASQAFDGAVALINVDAHLDLRPPGPSGITSGSPFFLALEHECVRAENFIEFGIQEHCNDASYLAYAQSKGVQVSGLDEIREGAGVEKNFRALLARFKKKKLKTVVSFDVDSVNMAHAPGVSAPQADGFTAGEFLKMAQICGEESSVATIGFFELAPPLDHNDKTSRLVATALHRFLSGLSRRKTSSSKNRSSRVTRLLRRS